MKKMIKIITDFEKLSVRILALGITVFLWSYITDIKGVCEILGDRSAIRFGNNIIIWGFRHFVYTITFSFLTLVQIAKIIKWINIKNRKGGFNI